MYVLDFKSYIFATKDIVHCCGQAIDEYQKIRTKDSTLFLYALTHFRNQSGHSEIEADIFHRKVMMKNLIGSCCHIFQQRAELTALLQIPFSALSIVMKYDNFFLQVLYNLKPRSEPAHVE
jgi:hypothetical protein